ncbi:MAG: hypothetical protein JST27_03075, partial [Bacteroidetes bacterium]|nr:hypothetical protein [Bacteroidota bacterium]
MNLKTYISCTALLLLSWAVSAQTFTQISLSGTPTLISGTTNQVNSVYKYANAGGAGNNKIDAYIQIMKTSNTGTDDVGVFALDQPASVNGGYDNAFQPVTSCSDVNSSGLWTQCYGSGQNQHCCGQGNVKITASSNQNYLVHFRLYFKKAGTQIDTALNITAAFIDIDGYGNNGDEREQNAFMPPASYSVSNNSYITFSNRSDGLINALGWDGNVNGIGFTNSTSIAEVKYLNRTFIDFGIGMNTFSANDYHGCYSATAGGRLASVSFCSTSSSCTTTTDLTVTLSGKVYDDSDGSGTSTFTNIKTGTETGTNGGGLYVYALDSATGTVIGKDAVGSGGAWSISDIPKNLGVVLLLSKQNVAVGVTNGAPTGELNTGWVSTSPLVRPSFRPTGNTNGLNFGIEQIPSGAAYTAPSQLNPGGTIKVSIPSVAFTGTDPEDGTYPSGLTGKTVKLTPGTGGTLYYNNTAVTATQTIANFDPTKVGVDPSGTTPSLVSSTFSYSVADNAGKFSVPVTITMPFEPPVIISGYVWDDANGNASKQSGENYTNAGGLNIVLTDASNKVLQVIAVNGTTGAYSFDQSISNTSYKVILTTSSPSVGSTLSASTLPTATTGDWVHTGVNIGGVANTANQTGIINITTGTSTSANNNLGIEQIPVGANVTASSQVNPGGTIQVPIPSSLFTGIDAEDGTYPSGLTGKTVTITPGTGGDIYYNGTKITGTQVIPNFDPTDLTLDPAGTTPVLITTTFTYSVKDNAGKYSTPKTISVPFDPSVPISGFVWDDGNGDAVKQSGENYSNAGGLNAVLTDAVGNVIQVSAVNATTGAYSFDLSTSNSSYKVVLTTANPGIGSSLTASTLPAGSYGNWQNTGVNLNNTANTGNTTGILSISTLTTAIPNQNFGIEQPPTGYSVTVPDQANPGGTNKVTIPSNAFTGTDPEDGNYTAGLTGRKVSLIPGTNGDLYYNGTLVTTTTTINAFDPTLVQIDPTGTNPTRYDAVTTTISYQLYDNAGVASTPKVITMNFTAVLCINVRAYLEGALVNNGSATATDGRPLMRDNLRNSPYNGTNVIPVNDPYETATTNVNVVSSYTKLAPQTTHPEFHQINDSSSVFSVTGQNAIVDWVFVELRSKSNNATVQATRAGLIQRDGDIVDVDGQSCLLFPGVAVDSYYVSVRHRDHLGAMTKYGQSASNLETLVDFTVPGTPIYDKGTFGPYNYA